MLGIDGRVTKKQSKWETRDANRFWGGCMGVDGVGGPAVFAVIAAAAVTVASVVAAVSALLKMFWGSLLRS
jgi:hypothetical protein